MIPGKPINVFSRCNFEGTTFKGNTSVGYKTGDYPSIADGIYDINIGWHNKYSAFWVNNNGDVSIQQWTNPRPPAGRYYMQGCHVHRGGEDWTWSEGCITIWAPDASRMGQWSRFTGLFPSNSTSPNYYGISSYRNSNNYRGLLDSTNVGILNITTL
jgi:hypothetical protein